MPTPTPDQIREALETVTGRWCHQCGITKRCAPCRQIQRAGRTLESALAQPPVEDAAVEEALAYVGEPCACDHQTVYSCEACTHHRTLRAALAAKDRSLAAHIENTSQMGEDDAALRRTVREQERELEDLRRGVTPMEAQLAAAEARGFRAAADFLEKDWGDCGNETSWAWRALRAEADRREGGR